MKNFCKWLGRGLFLLVVGGLPVAPALAAPLKVFACEPEWAALTRQLAGERADVFVATTALQDPHRIEARPALIARIRQADLLVCTGAELETGWLPVLRQQSGNSRIQPGQPGDFAAATHVTLLERPATLDRAQGDVHAAGNPHVQLDPRRMPPIARALAERLQTLDPAGAAHYRQALQRFDQLWAAHLARWAQQASPLRGVAYVAQHRSPYLAEWLGMREVAALEPKPGVEPSSAHLAALAGSLRQQAPRLIVRAAYQDERAADWLAARSGLAVAVIPFTVGGSPAATDLAGVYEDTVQRLLAALAAAPGGGR